MDNIEFLTWIARGFNPITSEKFNNDDLLRNPDVVSRLYDLILELNKDSHLTPVEQTDEIDRIDFKDLIKPIEPYTTISHLVEKISDVTSISKYNVTNKVRKYLLDNGYLIATKRSKNSKATDKLATDKGESIGITNHDAVSEKGRAYILIRYSVEAQNFIISNLKNILK